MGTITSAEQLWLLRDGGEGDRKTGDRRWLKIATDCPEYGLDETSVSPHKASCLFLSIKTGGKPRAAGLWRPSPANLYPLDPTACMRSPPEKKNKTLWQSLRCAYTAPFTASSERDLCSSKCTHSCLGRP